jgi:hypothetical protein
LWFQTAEILEGTATLISPPELQDISLPPPFFMPPRGHGLKILFRIQEILTKIIKKSGAGQMVK